MGSHSPGHSSLNSIESIMISTDGISLEKVNFFYILALVKNENLSWNDHIEHIGLVILTTSSLSRSLTNLWNSRSLPQWVTLRR